MLGLHEAVDAASADVDGVVGTIAAVHVDEVVLLVGDRHVSVKPAPGARMYSGGYGATTSLTAFIIGDRVAAQGTLNGAQMDATFLGSVYRPVTARVQSVSADRSVARTDIGDIDLEDAELPFTAPARQAVLRKSSSIRKGSVIEGLVWRHPVTRQTYLLVAR